jgi:phage recombination protein Bet
MNTQTVRSRAIVAQDSAIAANVAKIEEAKARPSALEALAGRLNVSAGALTSTLKNTVFKGASNEEFVALVIVSNAYNLNPLLKEIYAYPAKGGGIIPVVSVDGWIRIINEHPQFDGIEFNDIVDEKGDLYAIESVIYRRDRSRPIKVTEYMDECKGQSPAWQKTPKRMLRHRSIIQGGRVAFGFSGIYVEDEAQTYVGTVQQDGGEAARNVSRPTREQVTYDASTGEIDEDTARALDREGFAAMEGRDNSNMGEANNGTLADHPARGIADGLIARCGGDDPGDVLNVEADFAKHRDAMPDELVGEVDRAIAAARGRLANSKGGK